MGLCTLTMKLSDLDPETLRVITQLHLEDLQEMEDSRYNKGKGREGDKSDFVTAIETYREDLSDAAQFLSDRAMCQSLTRAAVLDVNQIREHEAEEERAANDRAMALELARGHSQQVAAPAQQLATGLPKPTQGQASGLGQQRAPALQQRAATPTQRRAPTTTRESSTNPQQTPVSTRPILQKRRLAAGEDDDFSGRAESSSWTAKRPRQAPATTRESSASPQQALTPTRPTLQKRKAITNEDDDSSVRAETSSRAAKRQRGAANPQQALISPQSILKERKTTTDKDDNSSVQAESSRETERQQVAFQPNDKDMCVTCSDYHYHEDLVKCDGCTHQYCRECIVSLFQVAMKDETLFPPRCCWVQIPIEGCRPFLSVDLMGQYQAKKIELDTPNRTYCHLPTCSAFIPPQFIKAGEATCVRCKAITCAVCKKAAHRDSSCPRDPATQEFVQLAKKAGYQRCYACSRYVELEFGCNHISRLSLCFAKRGNGEGAC